MHLSQITVDAVLSEEDMCILHLAAEEQRIDGEVESDQRRGNVTGERQRIELKGLIARFATDSKVGDEGSVAVPTLFLVIEYTFD